MKKRGHTCEQTDSRQRETDTQADHQMGSFIKKTVKPRTVFG